MWRKFYNMHCFVMFVTTVCITSTNVCEHSINQEDSKSCASPRAEHFSFSISQTSTRVSGRNTVHVFYVKGVPWSPGYLLVDALLLVTHCRSPIMRSPFFFPFSSYETICNSVIQYRKLVYTKTVYRVEGSP